MLFIANAMDGIYGQKNIWVIVKTVNMTAIVVMAVLARLVNARIASAKKNHNALV